MYLILNNDDKVNQNYHENIITALYSSEDIGAVGPVTNSASYYSAIKVNYNSIDDMQKFAYNFNKVDSLKWEERLKLIGFCMLVKRVVIDQVGLLDERFTPGNFEDDDFSLRIRTAGYKLMICKDTFIHHFGSVSFKKDQEKYNSLIRVNKEKFREKW